MANGLLRQIAAGGHIHGGNMKTTIPKKSICLAGGTIYVIENAVSPAAKETGYEKLKRMVDSKRFLSIPIARRVADG